MRVPAEAMPTLMRQFSDLSPTGAALAAIQHAWFGADHLLRACSSWLSPHSPSAQRPSPRSDGSDQPTAARQASLLPNAAGERRSRRRIATGYGWTPRIGTARSRFGAPLVAPEPDLGFERPHDRGYRSLQRAVDRGPVARRSVEPCDQRIDWDARLEFGPPYGAGTSVR
jgi:hypothetical protein